MARIPDADQGGLPVPRLDSCGPDRTRSRALPRPRTTHAGATPPGNPGMAKLLLQVTDDAAGLVSGARSVHPAHQAEEHSAVPEGRRADHAFGTGILRLGRVARAPSPASLHSTIPMSARDRIFRWLVRSPRLAAPKPDTTHAT